MAQYLDTDDNTTKLIIFGIGIAALGFIAIVLYRGSCQSQPTQYLAQGQCPTCSHMALPALPYAMNSMNQNQYSPDIHSIEHRLEKLEEDKTASKFGFLEQKLLSLENKIEELIKSTKVPQVTNIKTVEQSSKDVPNVVSMSKIKPLENVKLTPAEHHTLLRNYFGMH